MYEGAGKGQEQAETLIIGITIHYCQMRAQPSSAGASEDAGSTPDANDAEGSEINSDRKEAFRELLDRHYDKDVLHTIYNNRKFCAGMVCISFSNFGSSERPNSTNSAMAKQKRKLMDKRPEHGEGAILLMDFEKEKELA